MGNCVLIEGEYKPFPRPELQGRWHPTKHSRWTRSHQATDIRTLEVWDSMGGCEYQTARDKGVIVVLSQHVSPKTGRTEYRCKGMSGNARRMWLLRCINADGTHSWNLGRHGVEHWERVEELPVLPSCPSWQSSQQTCHSPGHAACIHLEGVSQVEGGPQIEGAPLRYCIPILETGNSH